jgi:hypothetical protein
MEYLHAFSPRSDWMIGDYLSAIGKDLADPVVQRLLEELELTDVEQDSPDRVYRGSKRQGLDTLFKSNRLTTIQVFVSPTRKFAAFSGELPFGLEREMAQDAVHLKLGQPLAFDEFDSKFRIGATKLVVAYDDNLIIKALHILEPL